MSTEEMRDQALTEQANKGHKMIWVTFRKEGLHKYVFARAGFCFEQNGHCADTFWHVQVVNVSMLVGWAGLLAS